MSTQQEINPQARIRRAIKMSERKDRKQSGKTRGRKWLLIKQAQCALYGHIGKKGAECFYCGYRFE